MKKTITLAIVLLILCCAAFPAVAQNSQIPWSAFSAGFGTATSPTTSVTSAIGQPLVGSTTEGGTSIVSGFLADTLLGGPVTAIKENLGQPLPAFYELEQNYPNPFNPTTTIVFHIPLPSIVTLKVFDVLGHEVATLVNERKPAGVHRIVFETKGLSGGVYFFQLQAREFVQTRKMLLIR